MHGRKGDLGRGVGDVPAIASDGVECHSLGVAGGDVAFPMLVVAAYVDGEAVAVAAEEGVGHRDVLLLRTEEEVAKDVVSDDPVATQQAQAQCQQPVCRKQRARDRAGLDANPGQ